MKKIKIKKQFSIDVVTEAVIIVILAICTLLVLYPLYFIIIASISDPAAVYNGEVFFKPVGIVFEGYKRIFGDNTVWRSYLNTLIFTVTGTSMGVLMTMCIAFPMSRKYFTGSKFIAVFVLLPMYFVGGLIPTFLIVKQLGLVGSPWAVILLQSLSVFNIIIARSYIQGSIPLDLDEAAYIDGAGYIRYFFTVVLPLSKPIVAVLVLYYGINYWNDYFLSMIYLSDESWYPLQLKLHSILMSAELSSNMQSGDDVYFAAYMQLVAGQVKYGMIIVSTIPMLILYPFLQKYFVQGVMIGSVKG